MSDALFHMFSDCRFMDLTLYQYGYEKCASGHTYGPYVRNHFLFHYIISGEGTLLVEDSSSNTSEYHLHEGTGFLIEPGRVNTYRADQKNPWEYTWVEFSGLRAKEILEDSGLSSASPVYVPSTSEDGERLKSELLYLANHPQGSAFHQIGHLYLIMDALTSGASSRRRTQISKRAEFYVNEAVIFISQNYSRAITVEDMARRCSLDRSYFGKIFRDTLGQSPQEFLIQYRMEKAAELLKSTELPVGEISRQVGYPNQLHFSRAFKNFYGIAPRIYRQNNKFL